MPSNRLCIHCQTPLEADADNRQVCSACAQRLQADQPTWFYAHNRQRLGPVPLTELQTLVLSGQLARTDMLLRAGGSQWQAAGTVTELFPADAENTRIYVNPGEREATDTTPPQAPVGNSSDDVTHGQEEHSFATQTEAEGVKLDGTAASAVVPGYAIVGELGRGGMGVVYKAIQAGLNRTVAIKMVLAGGHAGAKELSRFRAEAEAVARLQHPHIVQIYEIGEHQGLPYFSLEYVDGGSLAQMLQGIPQPGVKAAGQIDTIARAVHFAHEHGIVHRDLKPANVLLTADGALKVTDFGLAKQLDSGKADTKSGAVLGTPSYMAPEQAAGRVRDISPRTDVYALGAILYEMLTGRPPFRGESVMDTILQVTWEEPVAPSRLVPKLSVDLETICLKCLQKDPGKRYVSAEALADDLRRFVSDLPIHARPVGRRERFWRWCRRNPLTATLTATVALTLLAGALIASYFAVQANRRAGEAERAARLAVAAEQQALEEKRRADENADDAKQSARRARWRVYLAAMQQVRHEYEAGRVDRVRKLLDDQMPEQTGGEDLRGFEWHYWDRASRSEIATLTGFDNAVVGVAFSPDGRRLAAVQAGKEAETPQKLLSVWDSVAGKKIYETAGEDCLAYSPDGKWLATRVNAKTAKILIHDAATGNEVRTLAGHNCPGLYGLAFSPDSRLLASAPGNGSGAIWDLASGDKVRTLNQGTRTLGVAFRPDGQELATSSDGNGMLLIWDVATGICKRKIEALPKTTEYVGLTKSLWSVAYSEDGKHLATGGEDGLVRIWEAATGKVLREFRGHIGTVNAVAFCPGHPLVASAGEDRTIRLWNLLAGGIEMRSFRGHTAPIKRIAFSPDGRRLASASEDRTVKIWEIRNEPGARQLRAYVGDPNAARFDPDGKRIVVGCRDGRICLFATDSGLLLPQPIAKHAALITDVAFSADGRRLALGSEDGVLNVWDLEAGKELWSGKRDAPAFGAIEFSPDGRQLAVASPIKKARILHADTGKEQFALPHEHGVVALKFTPDGKYLVSADADLNGWVGVTLTHTASQIFVWDALTGRRVRSFAGHRGPIASLDVSSDGKWLAAGCLDGTVKVCTLADGKEKITLNAHSGIVPTVLFNSSGRLLATWGIYAPGSRHGDSALWDLESEQRLLTLDGAVTSMSPDGTKLALLRQGEVLLIDGATNTEESRLQTQAINLFDFTRYRSSLRADIVTALQNDTTAPEAVRRRAMQIAEVYRESPEWLNAQAGWAVKVAPLDYDVTAQRRQTSLRLAEAAVRLEPDNLEYRTTLGALQYGAGLYREAVLTLAPGGKAKQPDAQALAHLAMAQFRTGDRDHSATLARLRNLIITNPKWRKDPEARKAYHEAVQVIEGVTIKTIAIDSWHVIGPFDNGAKDTGLEKSFPPEQTIDLTASYQGKKGPVRWRTVTADERGYVDLLTDVGDSPETTSYAYRELESTEDHEALILLGSDDCDKLWVNGELVHTHKTRRRAVPDADVVSVRLKKGRNRLLLKVTNVDGLHGFFLRCETRYPLKAVD